MQDQPQTEETTASEEPGFFDKLRSFFKKEPTTAEEFSKTLKRAHGQKIIDTEAFTMMEGALKVGHLCASDLMAIGAMNALIDMDIFRPVCGFDGITLMGYVGKQMNTIRQDFYSISSRAVEEVHQLMNGGEGHQVIMPHSIVKMYYKDIIC